MSKLAYVFLWLAALAIAAPHSLAAQTDVIRGRVTNGLRDNVVADLKRLKRDMEAELRGTGDGRRATEAACLPAGCRCTSCLLLAAARP